MEKKIVILASGTRGDVQPYLALGLGLQSAGYRVSVAAPVAFRQMVEGFGFPFLLVDGNPSDLMTAQEGQPAFTFDGSWLRSLRSSLRFLRAARPVYTRMLESSWHACQGADAPGDWPGDYLGCSHCRSARHPLPVVFFAAIQPYAPLPKRLVAGALLLRQGL